MKAIIVGIGAAGFSWYKRLRDRGMIAAVVETNEANREKMGDDPFPFFTSLEEALSNVEADFLVNVTPPMAHTRVNHAAFDRKLPVLSEKPISFSWAESVEIVQRAARENIPFMIAENYRRFAYVRKMEKLIDDGAIGRVSTIDILFARYHQVQRNYTVQLLEDVGVHHMDMIRYLTGAEGRRMSGHLYNPISGWDEEGAVLNAQLLIEMENDVRVTYSGSIAARGPATPWSGNWRIDGTEGAIELINQVIVLTRNGTSERIEDFSDVPKSDTLNDFLTSLADNSRMETAAADYLKSEALVHFAKEASRQQRTVDVLLPDIRA